MRVYLPSTSSGLRRLRDGESVGALPLTAFSVTPGLREWYVDDHLEALEYAAMIQAARASLRLIDADPSAARRRVVVAVDVPEASVTVHDDIDLGVVRIIEPIALSEVAAVHVDDAAAESAVTRAAPSIGAADLGDPRAQDAVDDAEGHELCWYDTAEIGPLLAALASDAGPSGHGRDDTPTDADE